MSKHGKPGHAKQQPPPNQNSGQEQKRKISGDVNVRGAIEANVSEGLIKKYISECNEQTPRDNVRFVLECITLAVVILYAALTAIIAWESIRASDAAVDGNRPIMWLISDFGHPDYLPESKQILWEVKFTNYGKTPAVDLLMGQTYIKTAINGRWNPTAGSETIKEKRIPHPVAPGEIITFDVLSLPEISPDEFNSLLATSEGISIKGTISYIDTTSESHEVAFCLTRVNGGGITFCGSNYIH